uniref:Uncharacterized protein n=1 Tax=Oryza sativa subsp. japonica TaxID=39947 RepID=Q5QMK4_ORYSJ|nr:hypothetical protein [Oryza sativa Japonica Group]BAD82292.1 hypothetical protein [Oryza sativa Japonica Group]
MNNTKIPKSSFSARARHWPPPPHRAPWLRAAAGRAAVGERMGACGERRRHGNVGILLPRRPSPAHQHDGIENGDGGVEDDDEDDALALTAAAEAEVAWAAVGGAEEEVAIYKIMDLNNTRVQL